MPSRTRQMLQRSQAWRGQCISLQPAFTILVACVGKQRPADSGGPQHPQAEKPLLGIRPGQSGHEHSSHGLRLKSPDRHRTVNEGGDADHDRQAGQHTFIGVDLTNVCDHRV